eukprot:GHVS01023751.1.p2 GENE.GHVS01023751.1~~GHVS01023751.1.p2  ORF type:complete len:306 (-),score=18.73 GHVS01023751.1:276-1193(-)
METERNRKPVWLGKIQPFIVGGLAGCMATTCVQPIDMIKVRIQLVGENAAPGASRSPFAVAGALIKKEGLLSLYTGLDAGLMRQITYTTARMGIFRVTSDAIKSPDEKTLPLYKKAGAGLFAGATAALVGNPADLSLIRLQADATLPVEQRRNYSGVFNAMSRTVKEDGILGLWRGSTPTVLRAMSLNMGMLASYDQAKETLAHRLGEGWGTSLIASAISGFFAVTLSLPFDFVKTRMQKMRADPVTGAMPYKNFGDCVMKVMKREGPLAFYAGYPTYYVRIAPHAMITLIAVEAVNTAIKDFWS